MLLLCLVEPASPVLPTRPVVELRLLRAFQLSLPLPGLEDFTSLA